MFNEVSKQTENIQQTHTNFVTPSYLSVPALAKRWECDEKLVYQEIAAKRLRGLRIGKKLLRVAVSEIERYEWEYQTSQEAAQ